MFGTNLNPAAISGAITLEWKVWGAGVGVKLGPIKFKVEANAVKAEGSLKKDDDNITAEATVKIVPR